MYLFPDDWNAVYRLDSENPFPSHCAESCACVSVRVSISVMATRVRVNDFINERKIT